MRTAIRRALAVLVLAGLVAAIWFRLQAGPYLQHEQPLRKADAVFVLSGSRVERALEAVDIYHAQYAPLILLSAGRPEPSEAMLRAKGIRFPSETDFLRDIIKQLDVPPSAVVAADGYFDNTAAEASYLRRIAVARGWHTVIVVTSKYHTRRAGFAMRRALDGTGVEIIMRATKYDLSDPAKWARSRADFRFVTSEWQKLIAYRLGLGE